jgi:hypothetical protein
LQVGNQATLGANKALSSTGQTYLTHNLYYDTGGTLQVYNTGSANEGALLQMVDGQLRFSQSSATTGTPAVNERFRVSGNGQFLIGASSFSDTTKLGVYGGSETSRLLQLEVSHTSGYGAVGFVNGNGTAGSISVYANSVTYNTSSDYRLKHDLQPMENATNRLKQLNPINFAWNTDNSRTDGFLAHEVQSVVPEAISGTHNEVEVWKDGEELPDGVSVGDNKLDEDGNTIPVYQGIDQSKLVPLLVKTIQELEARITALENA